MSKKYRSQRKIKKTKYKKQKSKKTNHGSEKKGLKKMIPIIIGIITFIGFTGIIALLPKITLNPGTALYNSNPLDITFTLSNEGLLKIRNINYEIDILHLGTDGGGKIEMHGNRNVKFVHTETEIPELKSGEQASLRRTLPLKGDNILINNCEIEILVSFKTLGWPFKKRFRYLAEKNINNQWKWTPKASSEKY